MNFPIKIMGEKGLVECHIYWIDTLEKLAQKQDYFSIGLVSFEAEYFEDRVILTRHVDYYTWEITGDIEATLSILYLM